jgi:DinB superfamily
MDPNRKTWNQQQQELRKALSDPDDSQLAKDLFLIQHAMVHTAVMSASGLWSFEDEVWQGSTEEITRAIPRGGDHSIAWIFWHLTRIEDITMNILLSGTQQLFTLGGWHDRLGTILRDTGNDMSQAEIMTLSNQLDIGALREYRIAIGRRTREIVVQLPAPDLNTKVSPARLQRLLDEGAVTEGARGLLDYWGGLTYAGLLLMPPTRHSFIHINEALRLKLKQQAVRK